MTQPKFAGQLITLDGIDGVGKSTQIDRLTEFLKASGHDVLNVRDPGSTKIGLKLRELLLDSDLELHRRTEAMLFMASRCEMIETIIRPALAAGRTVVSDRFLLANVVYQSVGGDGSSGRQEVDAETLWKLGRLSTGGLDPDITLLLDMPAKSALARLDRATDRMEERGESYMESVRQAFLKQRHHAGGRSFVINADAEPDAVFAQMASAIG
ncbi:dTMP kinase [Rubripirellula obstinata]|nr:dTMP kinase [Rubripirellula obstinata]